MVVAALNIELHKEQQEIVIDEGKYFDLLDDLKEVEKVAILKRNEVLYYEIADSILKDNGIKPYIIKKYLPLLNKVINTYLNYILNCHEIHIKKSLYYYK